MLEGRLLCCARCQARGFNCACACGDDKNWKRKWHQGLANQKAIRSRPTRRGAVQLGGAPPLSQYGATALLEAFSLDLATGCHGPLVALQSRKLSAIRAPWCESGVRGFSARHAGAREPRLRWVGGRDCFVFRAGFKSEPEANRMLLALHCINLKVDSSAPLSAIPLTLIKTVVHVERSAFRQTPAHTKSGA